MKQPEAIKEYEQLVLNILKSQGAPRVGAKIVSIAFTEPEEQSLEQLAEKTDYSLATVSNTVRYLENLKVVERVRKPGSKKIYVKPQRNFIKSLEQKMETAHKTQITMGLEKLPIIIKDMKQTIKETKNKKWKEHFKEHLKVMENHYEQIQLMEEIFSEMMRTIKKKREEIMKR
ncbi:MAG: GbsR/MarR family transcriptional regulator [Candidatus Woesearchaeota archaeon]